MRCVRFGVIGLVWTAAIWFSDIIHSPLLQANVPYLAAAAITHHAHLRKSVRFFLGLMR